VCRDLYKITSRNGRSDAFVLFVHHQLPREFAIL
jgi:hypothetical protein